MCTPNNTWLQNTIEIDSSKPTHFWLHYFSLVNPCTLQNITWSLNTLSKAPFEISQNKQTNNNDDEVTESEVLVKMLQLHSERWDISSANEERIVVENQHLLDAFFSLNIAFALSWDLRPCELILVKISKIRKKILRQRLMLGNCWRRRRRWS